MSDMTRWLEKIKKQKEFQAMPVKEITVTCKGTTKAGKPCKNQSVKDGYCKIHQESGE
ncbi:DUF5763 domain-containing protein [Priestia megaterium]